nr:DUF4923 family protein [Prevotella sp.]
MKINFMKVAVVALMLTAGAKANAQVNLSNILSGIASSSESTTTSSSSSSTSGLGSLVNSLTTIYNSTKTASADDLVGTWSYTEPAVVLSSNNALKNIGGKVAAAAIEKKLQTYFSKYGITKGKMKITFTKDGNFTQTIGKKKLSGTYTVSGKNVSLVYTGGFKQIGTTQLDGNSLQIVMDASKLLKYGKTIGSLTGNSTASTLGSLVSSYKGLQVGMTLQK